ncbi:MAG TPA: septum formation initiator family protein [Candidatus Saccharimonadales bacterium]|jgi:cell division protein FtsB
MDLKIKNYQKRLAKQLTRFGDIRFTGQLIFLAIVLLIFWSGVRAVQSNYNLQQQTAELKQQNQVAQLENSTIALQNKYYNSNQYLQLSARQNFGLAAPGETELIVPQSVALSYTQNVPDLSQSTSTSTTTKTQSNYKTWVDFFLHRYSSR